jgi:NTE family protein
MDAPTALEAFLAKTLLFSVLPPDALRSLAASLTRVELAKGDVLFEAGARGDDAFLINVGLIQIVDDSGPAARILSELGRGDHLGEMAVLTGEPRAAGAVAAVESVLYVIPGDTLRQLLDTHPLLYARLSLGLMRHLQAGRRPEPVGVRTCALIAIGGAGDVSLSLTLALAEELAARLGERVAVLDCATAPAPSPGADLPDALDDVTQTLRRLVVPLPAPPAEGVTVVRLGDDCASDSPIGGLVAELSRRHDRVLAHVAPPWPAPTSRVVAQCDQVRWIMLADERADAARACGEALRELGLPATQEAGPRIVLAHANDEGAAAGGGPAGHVVPLDRGRPFAAPEARRALRVLARQLAGCQTALVLGAGGAKGFAHLGALRAFERHGIEFDAVAGTSIGAIIGALVAMRWTVGDLESMFMGVAANPWQKLLDPRLPTEAFFRSKKKRELIGLHCGDRQIEGLPMPFFAVAGDLTTLSSVVFRTGSLALALDATSAIPAVFRPVRSGAQLLVDGWVCNPLPADVVRSERYRRVVAVDLSPRAGRGQPRSGPTAIAAALGGRFRILAIAMRAIELASQEHVARSLPLVDVLVRPELDGYTSTDLDAAAEMRDLGERAAEEALPAITALATDREERHASAAPRRAGRGEREAPGSGQQE